MKKIILVITLLTSMFMFSSCKVNWFGSSFNVPWYFIVIPVVVLFLVLYVTIISKIYICSECKTEIKPKWYQLSVCIHHMDQRVVKCPKCGRKGFCKRKK